MFLCSSCLPSFQSTDPMSRASKNQVTTGVRVRKNSYYALLANACLQEISTRRLEDGLSYRTHAVPDVEWEHGRAHRMVKARAGQVRPPPKSCGQNGAFVQCTVRCRCQPRLAALPDDKTRRTCAPTVHAGGDDVRRARSPAVHAGDNAADVGGEGASRAASMLAHPLPRVHGRLELRSHLTLELLIELVELRLQRECSIHPSAGDAAQRVTASGGFCGFVVQDLRHRRCGRGAPSAEAR